MIKDQKVDVYVDEVSVADAVWLYCITQKGGRLTLALSPVENGKPRHRVHFALLRHLIVESGGVVDEDLDGDNYQQLHGKFFKLLCDVDRKDKHEWVAFPKKGKVIDAFPLPLSDEGRAAACEAELGA